MHHVSGLPVLNSHKAVVGFISEKDIIAAFFPETHRVEDSELLTFNYVARLIKKTSNIVSQHMNSSLHFVTEQTELSEIAALFLQKGIKRLPVLCGKQLRGIIDRGSLINYVH